MEKPISHTLRNQHIKFIPARKPNFNLETPDGRVALIYKSAPKTKFSPWLLAFGASAPGTFLTNMLELPIDPTLQMAASVLFPLASLYSYHGLRMLRLVR